MTSLLQPRGLSSFVLVTSDGDPVPPQSVVTRLARDYGDALRIEWVRGWKPYFGLKKQWSSEDPRWQRVNTGELSPESAFDLEAMFPVDRTGEQMNAYLDNHYGERNRLSEADAAKEAERMAVASVEGQRKQLDANVTKTAHESNERSVRESPHEKRVRAGAEEAHPIVPGGLTL